MISKKMQALGEKASAIREIFEYGRRRKEEIGAENVYDFSLGNPSIPAPESVTETLLKLVEEREPCALHGYTSAAGDAGVRGRIAAFLRESFGFEADPNLIYMTCGAAASLTIALHAIVEPGDEVIVLAPYFPEYRVFAEKAGAKVIEVPCRTGDFQIDPAAVEKAISPKTKAILVNSPNNPTGAVYSEASLKELAAVLYEKRKAFGSTVFLIADEPYRELVYGDVKVPFLPSLYDAALLCYSFSKSLSLPGERIGYLAVSPHCPEKKSVFAAVCGAGRSLGFVCAPSLLQYTVAENLGKTADLSEYRENRELLCSALREIGYEFSPPDGAFYLFVKSLEPDEAAFCERAKKYDLLLVPSASFGCAGYVRISYCVTKKQILDSLPAFRALWNEYQESET